MRAAESRFDWLADSLSQLVWTVDAAGRLSYGNSAWHVFTGIGEGAHFLESYLPTLHPEDRFLWRRAWEHGVATGEPYAVERRVRFTAESNYVRQLESGTPITDSVGRTVEWIIIAKDADENERLIAQLRRSLEGKEKFLALVAHEMRGPLAPISSALKLLVQHSNEPAVVGKSCATMTRQVAQLVRLVNDLLDFARSENAQFLLTRGSINLESTISSAIEEAQPIIAARGHQLTVVAPPNATIVQGDEGRLTQVFANLLINAAKFTDNSGQIAVLIEREPDWALVKVRDSGIGISRELLPRIFDAYMQVERGSGAAKGGLGLGLALARHLIELHGGTVNAHSDGPGRGSEFVVRLPASRGQECLGGCVAVGGSSPALT